MCGGARGRVSWAAASNPPRKGVLKTVEFSVVVAVPS